MYVCLTVDLFSGPLGASQISTKSLSKQPAYPFPSCSECNFCVFSDWADHPSSLLSLITFGQRRPSVAVWLYTCITANQTSATAVVHSSRDAHQHPKDTLIKHKPLHTHRRTHSNIDLCLSRLPSFIETDGGVKAWGEKVGQRSHCGLLANRFILIQLLHCINQLHWAEKSFALRLLFTLKHHQRYLCTQKLKHKDADLHVCEYMHIKRQVLAEEQVQHSARLHAQSVFLWCREHKCYTFPSLNAWASVKANSQQCLNDSIIDTVRSGSEITGHSPLGSPPWSLGKAQLTLSF